MSTFYTIAIDGPAGAGKSTVAKGVAQSLKYTYVDTGAMYRAITFLALKQNIDLADTAALSEIAEKADILINDFHNKTDIIINGENVTEKIREPIVTQNVSQVSSVQEVRSQLLKIQRSMAANGGVVMEGRDIGTVVLPKADFKFYITASPSIRARRRAKDLEIMGYNIDLEKLIKEIELRDHMDSTRKINPLRVAEDAVIIDCSHINAQEVIDLIVNKVLEGRA